MNVLGIETTCDETAASVVASGKQILSNVVASSADLHAQYGGVFPELACRCHIETIERVISQAIQLADVSLEQLDLIAVAKGPGLVGALLIGMNTAKGLSLSLKKPLIGVNHVEAHLYASMMGLSEIPLPALGIVLSGGHTFLIKILDVGSYTPLSTTVDDAIGEAFDKVASLLGLPYPGGPHIEALAKNGNPGKYPFKAGQVKENPLDFSFSGLKTNVLYTIRKNPFKKEDIAASFQETAFLDIVKKAKKASQTFPCQAIFFGGGVTINQRLREMFEITFDSTPLFWPPKELCLDNAAMIAGLGFKKYIGISDPLDMEVKTRIPVA
ncbi:MAG: tRNA (adenosine(37)-N6)-threonylcarbamoyltransferase complex transferase subunit TsaD [Chlamydiae bacterium RIFCSPHIGHO2_12_FULL_44_59]|nr:MAG: tRNA (adenosine(37)-N6)-threonylcarbamoyltransferase complex transferase subunit TsaD [Chlamydiae bacterium RIFCSPHIGHO2_01_FULL_44_39]OGN59882.1 MAG: tRNA (adenosine(37)-N6)-threonylcarbamoyltransferase complex transferase subunit TsaD [Chlamydiae bacterium RIFCSPHIGHO2_12_FULL_44_59]OGN66089.1 MAG: tRNA (adenosine(37)-N6)-threonylcarbamoyltransferase complex transferase subunit TsaD [Chlamydiae bacterium RIFCSPLOWO2_01_FULL_44_52]OGN68625.1 MAG: tRNA (adenosine(37)-N6)-threonylcarbamoy